MPQFIRASSRAQTVRTASALGALALALALAGLLISGCIAVGGTDQHIKPTLGRQLIDLKQARDTGAIDDGQYENAKKELLAKG